MGEKNQEKWGEMRKNEGKWGKKEGKKSKEKMRKK